MPSRNTAGTKPLTVVALACLCAAAGLFAVHWAVGELLVAWRSDDLKSMGLVVPFLCAALILRAWKSIGWRPAQSQVAPWWGVALLAGLAVLLYFREHSLLIVTINRGWLVQLPPLPLVAILYATALVLAFGGTSLLRIAWFPVLLMGAVIPVPHSFSLWVDLPLQHASASVARAFAHALGEALTQDSLRLMFTPDFGMFIAPGCNGIRGAVTLGLAAVVIGYMYRFRWFVFAPVVAGAVLMGYLFNLVRLCTLVLYYKIALPYPWLQQRATGADYIIGAVLFLCAMFLFFAVANRLRRHPEDVHPAAAATTPIAGTPAAPVFARTAVILLLAAICSVDTLHSYRQAQAQAALRPKLVSFPAKLGDFALTRTWTETLIDGTVVYAWGEYSAPDLPRQPGTGAAISFGISPTLGLHDTTTCHMTRGENPVWVGQLAAPTAGSPTSLSTTLFNIGRSLKLEAATVCGDRACRQFTEASEHVTLIFSGPGKSGAANARPVPVLIKAELQDTSATPAAAAAKLSSDVRRFLTGVDLAGMTAPYSVQ